MYYITFILLQIEKIYILLIVLKALQKSSHFNEEINVLKYILLWIKMGKSNPSQMLLEHVSDKRVDYYNIRETSNKKFI